MMRVSFLTALIAPDGVWFRGWKWGILSEEHKGAELAIFFERELLMLAKA
jgi:hypothetical protein